MKTPGWQYDEMKTVGVNYSDISEVQAYDERMGRLRDVKHECREIVNILGLTPASTVIEFGAGTGAFATEAARHCARVIAVDTSAAMIEFARRRAVKAGVKNIEFHQAGFLSYEHPGEPVDALVSQIALHHLPDFWKLIALKRVYRMLKDGGRLYLRDVVFSFDSDSYQSFFDRWIEGIRTAAGEEMAQDTEISIRDEYYTLDWVMEGLLARAGFAIIKVEYTEGFMAVYRCEKKR